MLATRTNHGCPEPCTRHLTPRYRWHLPTQSSPARNTSCTELSSWCPRSLAQQLSPSSIFISPRTPFQQPALAVEISLNMAIDSQHLDDPSLFATKHKEASSQKHQSSHCPPCPTSSNSDGYRDPSGAHSGDECEQGQPRDWDRGFSFQSLGRTLQAWPFRLGSCSQQVGGQADSSARTCTAGLASSWTMPSQE